MQHFLGIEIRTKQPLTDTHIATLMDFRVDQSKGCILSMPCPFQMIVYSLNQP